MISIGMNNYMVDMKLTTPQSSLSQSSEKEVVQQVLQVESDEVQQVNKVEYQDIMDNIESFTYGVLGMRHPIEVKEDPDESYSAGQYLKGAIAAGTLLFAII